MRALLEEAQKKGLVVVSDQPNIDTNAPLPPPVTISSFYFDKSKCGWNDSLNLPRSVNQSNPHQISLMTWNIDAQALFLKERSIQALQVMKSLSPDFICLQEVAPYVWKNFLLEDWVRETYYVTDIDCSTFSCNAHGTCILSKFRPEHVFLQDFHSEGNRKSLTITILLHDSPFQISCLHLDSGHSPSEYNIRNHQLRTQYQLMNAKDSLFMGDLNVHEKEHVLLNDGWVDVWEVLHPSEVGYTWDTDVNPFTEFRRRYLPGASFRKLQERHDRIILKQLDSNWKPESIRIMGDSEIKVEWQGNLHTIFPSDHLGLFATLARTDL